MILGIESSGKGITVDFVKNLLLQEVIFESNMIVRFSVKIITNGKKIPRVLKKKQENIKCLNAVSRIWSKTVREKRK